MFAICLACLLPLFSHQTFFWCSRTTGNVNKVLFWQLNCRCPSAKLNFFLTFFQSYFPRFSTQHYHVWRARTKTDQLKDLKLKNSYRKIWINFRVFFGNFFEISVNRFCSNVQWVNVQASRHENQECVWV